MAGALLAEAPPQRSVRAQSLRARQTYRREPTARLYPRLHPPTCPRPPTPQVYGAVVLNSTLCLGCFLAVIYSKRLPWTFGPEVATVLLPTLALGGFAATRRSWPAAWGVGALAAYPLSLMLQALMMRWAGQL